MADRPPTFDVPDQRDEPVVWDPRARTFVPVERAQPAGGAGARRRWYVGPDAVGNAPPPRLGTPPPAGARAPDATTVGPPAAPPRPGRSRPAGPAARPAPAEPARRARRRLPLPRLRRPKLRWILAIVGLLPLLVLLGGWLYANHLFGRIERVPVGEVLDAAGGGGTNYLIVGSDSREVVAEAGVDDPNIQPGGEAPAGQRSDTMMVLRIEPDGAKMLSIPRDLLVTNASSGEQGRINGAYRDGAANLVRTIQQNLSIPVHRYMEVDFVTFSSLVDALGGITLGPDVVPHPAHDDRSGLDIGAGPVELDGRMALAFVRSRHYTEVIDGEEHTDPTGDLGRVKRQQAFLRTLMAEVAGTRNPFELLRVGSAVADGLRIDDEMSLIDAVRFAWNMRRLEPESLELPVANHRTSGGAAVLVLADGADGVLDQFR